MPSSRRLIASNTLGSSAASVTFSDIPGTYTDLVVRLGVRDNNTGGAASGSQVKIRFNGNTGSIYSRLSLWGDGSVAQTSAPGYESYLRLHGENRDGSTSNTFSNVEFYIPNYAGTTTKQCSGFGVSETNASTYDYGVNVQAFLVNLTSAITSISFEPGDGTSYLSGSSFFLYGLSNT